MEQYPGDVRIVFKHMPLSFHKNAPAAHAAAEAARMQDKFWEMHDLLFEDGVSGVFCEAGRASGF